MADFKTAFEARLKIEGGYSDDPEDNGNWTGGKKGIGIMIGSNLGVSAAVLCKFLKRIATIQDMKDLTPATAALIYKPEYWDVFWGDQVISQDEATIIYNNCVNLGPGEGVILAKEALGLADQSPLMNTATLNTLNNKS